MAKKTEERAKARRLFVEFGMNFKEIAAMLKVRENTIGGWAKEDNWKALRSAKLFSKAKLAQNYTELMVAYSEITLELLGRRKEIMELPEEMRDKKELLQINKEIVAIADAQSKSKNQYEKTERHNKTDLITYLNVMDQIFRALQNEDPKLHSLTLDFQERHVQEVAKLLG